MDWCHDLSVQRQRPDHADECRELYLHVGDSHDHYGHRNGRDPLSVLGLLMRRLLLLLGLLLPSSAASAQTFDKYGGEITNQLGQTMPLCTAQSGSWHS